ncbi:MAG TPA: glycosyltransferase family 1 protein [Stellaceae bacterium]
MGGRIYFDGLNLALPQGTGIATYARLLARVTRELGHSVGLVYGARRRPSLNPLLQEIALFDVYGDGGGSRFREVVDVLADQLWIPFGVKPRPINLSGRVVAEHLRDRFPSHASLFAERNLFANARRYFRWSGRFVELDFDTRPDVFHCTYQMPVRAKSAANVYTIHDLVPLLLPFATGDDKRRTLRLFNKIAAEADHIVTVSENSKKDIVQLLGIDEGRVTTTYQAVEFPQDSLDRSADTVAEQLLGSFGLMSGDYLLFYGALEPKKNVGRLIEAYLLSQVDIPLVIAGNAGWSSDHEKKLIAQFALTGREALNRRRSIVHLDYVTSRILIDLIRGARAVLFPSLYEGFGLPVLEAMMLGTPVVTSRTSSLPEVGGDAAVYVNPYETAEIARAIHTIVADSDLRRDLSRRGRTQAEQFSVDRYRERIGDLYKQLL